MMLRHSVHGVEADFQQKLSGNTQREDLTIGVIPGEMIHFHANGLITRIAMQISSAQGDTEPVNSYEAGISPFGLYNMIGNVLEWVADWSGPYPSGQITDPPGPSSGSLRIMRGGAWFSGGIVEGLDLNFRLHVAFRQQNDPALVANNFGFRCAKDN